MHLKLLKLVLQLISLLKEIKKVNRNNGMMFLIKKQTLYGKKQIFMITNLKIKLKKLLNNAVMSKF